MFLFEDDDVLVVNKPAGVTVIPDRQGAPGLQQQLQEERNARLWVVHRIDKDTSGVLLFAKTAAAHKAWNDRFEQRALTKTYLAITRGVPPPHGRIDVAIGKGRKGRMRPDDNGQASLTEYRVLHARDDIALVEARPKTGRQHQIRVHLRAIGTPLLVDPLYGGEHALMPRLSLHALRLEHWEAPPPADMQAAMDWIYNVPSNANTR